MARHNRDARGTDQRGFDYDISYQPDWLRLIKVTRTLESGRQSTKTLFRNPGQREQSAGPKVRTHVGSPEQKLDVEIELTDPRAVVKRVIIVATLTDADGVEEELEFTIEHGNNPSEPEP